MISFKSYTKTKCRGDIAKLSTSCNKYLFYQTFVENAVAAIAVEAFSVVVVVVVAELHFAVVVYQHCHALLATIAADTDIHEHVYFPLLVI